MGVKLVKTGLATGLTDLELYLLLSTFVQFVGPVTTKLKSYLLEFSLHKIKNCK